MPRNISFMMTTEQVRNKTKTVTRRDGWDFVKVGDILQGVEQCQGIPKGGSMVKLHRIRVTGTRWEPLDRLLKEPEYGKAEMILEGFPRFTPMQFVTMYLKGAIDKASKEVNRIEFSYTLCTFECVGSSRDLRTNRWKVTCPCRKVYSPPTTYLAEQLVTCPKCGYEEFVNYNDYLDEED